MCLTIARKGASITTAKEVWLAIVSLTSDRIAMVYVATIHCRRRHSFSSRRDHFRIDKLERSLWSTDGN